MDLEEPFDDEQYQDDYILDQLGLSSPHAPHEFAPIPEESTGRESHPHYSPGAEVLIMSVDLGDGRTGQITVHENDDPHSLARAFCRRYQLTADLVAPLTEQIQANVGNLTHTNSPEPEMSAWKEQMSQLIKQPSNRPMVNDRSKEMLKDRRNVFDRLQPKPVAAKPDPPEQSKPVRCYPGFANPGEKLYFKGLKMKEDVRKQCAELQKAKGSEESKDLTFAPKLNENSVLMTKRSRSALKVRTPEDLLLVRGRISQENKEKQRGEVLAQEHSVCTFVPSINPVSERIASQVNRSSSANRFVELHEDAQRRRERQVQTAMTYLHENYPFRPVLSSKQYSVSEHPPLYSRESHRDLEKERARVEKDVDETTGQTLFRPKVGRSPRRPRNPDNEPVGDYLYKMRSASRSKTHGTQEKVDVTSASKDVSERLLRKKRRARYQQIFDQLNPDENQQINAARIVVEDIDREVLMIIAPLLEELENLKETLNFAEFEDAMDALVRTLNPEEKAKLLNYAKKDTVGLADDSHRPQINAYTGSERFRQRRQTPFYERIMEHKKQVEEKLAAQKLLKQEKELQECSFQPKTIPYAPRHSQLLEDSEAFPNSWCVG